ncbi:MAG: FAD-dependent oxidoreductase [Beijerinckiaceae bacterium]
MPQAVDYQSLTFDYRRSPDQDAAQPAHYPVIVVGAGPVGLSAAIDLAQHGVKTLVLDDDNRLSAGSRAICFAKRTLEIWDRLGCGDRMVEKGVSWNRGKVFFKDELVYSFDLLAEEGHRRPAFINLQQYYAEGFLVERAVEYSAIDLRWKNAVTAIAQDGERAAVTVETPDGPYQVTADYIIACDGSRSPLRAILGLDSKGQTFRDRFLIADVKMKADFPAERWFWFDPPFHPNQSVLLHMQPDNVWRIDFQLGWDADPEEEKKPERIIPRVKALLGKDAAFDLEWASVYTFTCRRMDAFRHGRIFFAGDSAHGVSPFGARGANSGVQDADNLVWKLKLVLDRLAPDALLDSYGTEREYAADENILNSTRSTDFITPKSDVSRVFRDATLALARDFPFARKLVNSGRLSVPATLFNSSLNTPDAEPFHGMMVPGAPCADAPVRTAKGESWLLNHLGETFTLLHFSNEARREKALADMAAIIGGSAVPLCAVLVLPDFAARAPINSIACVEDHTALAAQRYDAKPGTTYLIRPDQHVCARWRHLDAAKISRAMTIATGNSKRGATA